MTRIYLLIVLMFISTVSVADESERLAAKRVLASFEVKPYRERAVDVANALISIDLGTSLDFDLLVSRIEELLKSEEFNRDMEDVYIEFFTEEELNEISLLLQNQALKKFLASRFEILAQTQEVMGGHMEKVLREP